MEKYEPKKIEDEIYKNWEEKGYFTADSKSDKEPFCIVIPPPNVTGSLHMGHALNNTLQDILSRYKRARGFNVLWLPGCDHAGIATQNVVERELKKEKKTKHDLGREKFEKKVWEWKDKYGKTIMTQLRKLGSSLDWTRERFTMDEGLSNAVKEVFIRLYNEGLIYRGDYIINWCPRCLTALSDIEVVHKDKDGNFWHIKYPVAGKKGEYIQVATTRPETMLGDTAVAVHPEDERYKKYETGTMLELPETGRQIPLIRDEYVDREFGTGAVKITPAHDPNDFEIGRRHNLEIINVMNENGTMNENAGISGKYKGLDRFECRKQLVEALKEQGVLPQVDGHKHAVGHCYRCDTIVEPYVSTQWFVKIKPLAEEAIKVVEEDRIKFVPDMWKKVYFEWMHNIKDWCISRQLWWGHRIPAYYCECGEMMVAKEPPKKCSKCGSSKITQDEDVLDTWFSSGLWPFSTLGWPEKTKDLETFYPTSVLVTSWDILFFWVARMIMSGMKFMGDIPYHTVVINSLVCDAEGKKMSKSKGNVVDPLHVMDEFSADSLRFTMAALETQQRHISFSEERLKSYHNFMNKIWNASKFTIANLEGMKEIGLKPAGLKMPEKWILSEAEKLKERVTEDLEKYRFSDAALSLYGFFWHEFCDWYVEISKIELYKEGNEYKNTVQNVLLKVLKDALLLMHPFIPFITEEIYKNLSFKEKKESIMLESWPALAPDFKAEVPEMKAVMDVIYHIRNLRGELAVSPGDKVDAYIDTEKNEILKGNTGIINFLAKSKSVIFEEPKKDSVVGRKAEGLGYIGIDIKGVVDVVKQKENLKKKKEKYEGFIKSVEKKLSNEKFVKNAPKKVVDEEKAKIEKNKEEAAKAEEMLAMLEKIM